MKLSNPPSGKGKQPNKKSQTKLDRLETGGSVNRLHLVIAGRMNAGKSTFLNALTQNNSAIVDSTPGTTADAKITLMEIHGLGACKLFDTAGLDEGNELGYKKREKTLKILNQADIVCIIQNKQNKRPQFWDTLIDEYTNYLAKPQKNEKYGQLIKNTKYITNTDQMIKKYCKTHNKDYIVINNDVDGKTDKIIKEKSNVYRMNLQKVKSHDVVQIIDHILQLKPPQVSDILPEFLLRKDATGAGNKQENILLIIPLDAQSPKLRLLRPQQMAIESLLSNHNSVISHRVDLQKARSADKKVQEEEMQKLRNLVENNDVSLIITDSQAVDVASKVAQKCELTTFSVMQQHYLLGKGLFRYVSDSLQHLKDLISKQPPILRVLISEACQHDRITDICEDIGTKQIPTKLKKLFPKAQLEITYSFGKDDGLMDDPYDLVIHCGGCMISRQHMQSRVGGFERRKTPVLSYGTFLSYAAGGDRLVNKVERVWK